ncbi:MAG: FliA/WhiG family RNA polymerase sigma factor [Magnetococcales bacterium]|nr:FliA/WhiG family RNA polymerase sigma factor [Magnetococcales bacterium]
MTDNVAGTWHGTSRDEVILRYAPLVKYVANRICMRLPSSVDVDDLYQVGILGLIDAVSKFDPDRGIKFQTYAEFRVRGAILDELRAMDWVPRAIRQAASLIEGAYQELESHYGRPAEDRDVAVKLGISLQELYEQLDEIRGVSIISLEDLRPNSEDEEWDSLDVLADDNTVDPIEKLGLTQLRAVLGQAIEGLPEKERLVITLYYFEELTMGEIGAVLNLTESRISQLHSKATLRIRARMNRELILKKKRRAS